MKRRHPLPPALLLLCAALGCSPAAAAEQISEAETLMFLADHLKKLPLPATLRYSFERRGSLEAAFEDSVSVALAKGAGKDAKSAATTCLSGERRTEVADVDFAQGNPALLCFLERDIREMERLTGGKANHFRQQIRRTLADDATVREAQISFGGKKVEAREVVITPYLKDMFRERFQRYAAKRYVFTFSDAVPGGLYRAESTVPDAAAAAQDSPLIRETMTFSGSEKGN